MASHQLTPPSIPPSPQRGQNWTAQPSMSIHDIAIGGIMYIREKHEISPTALLNSELEHLSLNHPCLVLDYGATSHSIYDANVTILILTSFAGGDLASKSENQQRHHLPIAPAPAHPMEGYPTLSMAQGQLKKPSYVKMHRAYTVHISMLKYYDRKPGPHTHIIDANSLATIQALLNSSPRRTSFSSPFSSPPASPSPQTEPHVRTYNHGPNYPNHGVPSPIPGQIYQVADGRFEQIFWTLDNFGYPMTYIQTYWYPPPPPIYEAPTYQAPMYQESTIPPFQLPAPAFSGAGDLFSPIDSSIGEPDDLLLSFYRNQIKIRALEEELFQVGAPSQVHERFGVTTTFLTAYERST